MEAQKNIRHTMRDFLQINKTTLMSAMPVVKKYDSRLGALNDWWGKIELVGKINSYNMDSTILDDMGLAKVKFSQLQKQLTHNLMIENLQKLVLDNTSKTQVAIDLLIRNLFERTADVGFLATDEDIRCFLATNDPTTDAILFIENRLQEYVSKYSVYDEIIILDTQGFVKAHLDKDNLISHSNEPLLKKTLESDQAYIETFGHSELQANRRHSLIYSCKITANQHDTKILGMLCLCFRFDDEINGIFANLLPKDNSAILTLLDADGKVIASSDEPTIPLGTTMPQRKEAATILYQGMDYIIASCKTKGFQGYYGLNWQCQMLTSLTSAFKHNESTFLRSKYINVIEQANIFPKALRDIRKTAADINADLGLLILNGQIASARKKAAEFMPVLEAIKKIGSDIAQIFTESVNSLEMTVLTSQLDNASFLASLATDIMDRSLYERANDCRWWALTTGFRRTLACPHFSEAHKQQIHEKLEYINGLYTVYSTLYIYNQLGEVLAVSNADHQAMVGRKVDESSGAFTALKSTDSQHYSVSKFVNSPIYQQRPTYIYNASITDLDDPESVLGGIGIVFDSEPQLTSMLQEVLPRATDGQIQQGSFAAFADRKKTIIAIANHPSLTTGNQLKLDDAFFSLTDGQRSSNIVEFDSVKYVLGVSASHGYREYKTSNNYANDVLAFVFIPL